MLTCHQIKVSLQISTRQPNTYIMPSYRCRFGKTHEEIYSLQINNISTFHPIQIRSIYCMFNWCDVTNLCQSVQQTLVTVTRIRHRTMIRRGRVIPLLSLCVVLVHSFTHIHTYTI